MMNGKTGMYLSAGLACFFSLSIIQPRVSALRKGKINEFRLDMLIDFALRLGLHVSIDVAA